MAALTCEPNRQAIRQLPMIAWAITGMADDAAAQLGNLRQAEEQPTSSTMSR
jgi:hypothetical protein